MRTIRFQCSTLQTAAYLTQALRRSVDHNPDSVFAITCHAAWHAHLVGFLPEEETRIQFTEELLLLLKQSIGVFDFDIALRALMAGHDRSLPRLFLTLFRHVADKMDFKSGLRDERDLLFSPRASIESAPSKVLFINDHNRLLSNVEMDCLIQSINDRRLSITTTQPSKAGHASWQDKRLLSDYAAIAATCDYVVGVAGANMAVSFSQQSINRVQGWFVIDPKITYPFSDRCYLATSFRDAVALLKQHELC